MSPSVSISVSGNFQDVAEAPPAPIVELKRLWSEKWTPAYWMEVLSVVLHSAASGATRADFKVRDGVIARARPGANNNVFAYEPLIDYSGWWVRISLPGATPSAVKAMVFVGRLVKQVVKPDNVSPDQYARANEQYVAVGPDRLIEQAHCSWSWQTSLAGPGIQRVDWLEGFNRRDHLGQMMGNRSAVKRDQCWAFGGTQLWSHYEMLCYVVERVLNQRGLNADGSLAANSGTLPANHIFWQIGGQVKSLAQLKTVVDFKEVTTADHMLKQIIPADLGFDYIIRPIEGATDSDDADERAEHFAIFVFSLLAMAVEAGALPEDMAAGGFKIPANPHPQDFDLRDVTDAHIVIEGCDAQLYDRIEVVGERIIMCLSAGQGQSLALATNWSAAHETEYKAGKVAGDADPTVEGAAALRADDKYRDVFQAFAIPNALSSLPTARIECADDGTITNVAKLTADPTRRICRTLSHLPFIVDVDYHTDPPVSSIPDGTVPEARPLLAVAKLTLGSQTIWSHVEKLHEYLYRPCSVSPLRTELGVRLNASPNHALAADHWSGALIDAFDPTVSGIDYLNVAFTLAYETDVRVRVASATEDGPGIGLTLVVHVPKVEVHLVAAETICGVDSAGALIKTPAHLMTIRDDRDVLHRTLAGIKARFGYQRARAVMTFWKILGGTQLIGTMLWNVQTDDNETLIGAAFTSMTFDFVHNTTICGAGHGR